MHSLREPQQLKVLLFPAVSLAWIRVCLKCCSLSRAGPTALPKLFLEGQVFTGRRERQMTEHGNTSAAKDRGGGGFCSFRD